ncbi:hypothetical protein WJX72_003628 [[Myrmecia] bisecta]|uniref:Nudix hydrolase domain-containing protein n=1 Tax=[Myrmecia] bisecta TaxID=41462 RepID=A0AAW1PHE8_9CHLO
MSRVLEKKDFGATGFRWLTLKRITYQDPEGRQRQWESAERTTRPDCGVDGVAIIARVLSATEPPKIILEAQFRPPQDAIVIELPAGLIDAGETAAEAAVRELKEETGYSGRVVEETPVCWSDPGMTNANMQVVVMDVDANAPENAIIHPELEDGEFIEVFLLPLEGLHEALLAVKAEKGWEMDARLLI